MAAGSAGLTQQQRRALGPRGVSVALSAGAGCGKTFVLTERFLVQLQPPQRPGQPPPRLGQLVAITFTERAAREMRERIRAACTLRLLESPEQEVDYWLGLIRELDSARISTIHSFCASLLRSHAVEARLDPRFRVLDQAQASTMLYDVLDERLRERLAARDETLIDLMVQFDVRPLYELLAGLVGRRQEIDWAGWRRETPEALVARWEDFWRRDTLPRVLRQLAGSQAADRLLRLARKECSSSPVMRQRCDLLLQRVASLPQSSSPLDDLREIREASKVQGGGSKKAWKSEQLYDEFRRAAGEFRKEIDRFLGGGSGCASFEPRAALPVARTSLRLLRVAADVAEAYEQVKRDEGVLDFDDLLIRARDLLTGPDRQQLRRRLSAQIRLLLVDEFQDTDPLQVELVRALCDGGLSRGKLFFVGDFKQSIYRFRGADPHVFRQLRRQMPAEGRLPLSLNFRSQPALLDFVNALFREEMGRDYEPLQPHREQLAPGPVVEFLWATEAEDEQPAGAEVGRAERLRRREADWIARRIRAMLDGPERLVRDEQAATPALRPVRPGDVALLFRALSDVEIYEEALRRYGLDYYLVGGHAFYAQQEIYDLLNLLRTLNSPCDEVSLAGALRSPLFGLLDETLYWLAEHPEGLSAGLFAGQWPAAIDGRQRRRVEFAAATLGQLRAMKDRLPIARLIGETLRRTGYDAALLAEFLGERKLANLHKLLDQARSFDRSGIFTLAEFITQLAEFVARQPDEPLAATHPETTDVVRLMTIHQSKGLEFPVVIVPDMDRARRGRFAPVAFTPQLGPMVRCPDVTSGFDLHKLVEDEEDRAEMVRLLYVATTRAADYLILSAGLRHPLSARGPWMELIQRRFDLLTGELRPAADADVEGPQAAPGHPPPAAAAPAPAGRSSSSEAAGPESGSLTAKVKVITTEPPLPSPPSAASRRQDLKGLLEKARRTAAEGGGRVPAYLAPVPPDPGARRQYSFSRLSGRLHAADETAPVGPPQDELSAGPPALDPRGLGTLVHEVLAEIDFSKPGDIPGLVRRHAPRHLPEAEDRPDEPAEMLRRFVASPRAAEIAAAAKVYRELEFLLAWPPGSRDPEARYLQGFIDCLYRDAAGGWHLLDYKTNRVTAADVQAAAAEYEMQMLVYALAVERILAAAPVELALCFLRPGLEHRFSWDEDARRRVVRLVDRALP